MPSRRRARARWASPSAIRRRAGSDAAAKAVVAIRERAIAEPVAKPPAPRRGTKQALLACLTEGGCLRDGHRQQYRDHRSANYVCWNMGNGCLSPAGCSHPDDGRQADRQMGLRARYFGGGCLGRWGAFCAVGPLYPPPKDAKPISGHRSAAYSEVAIKRQAKAPPLQVLACLAIT